MPDNAELIMRFHPVGGEDVRSSTEWAIRSSASFSPPKSLSAGPAGTTRLVVRERYADARQWRR
jgi:hypothetical protein